MAVEGSITIPEVGGELGFELPWDQNWQRQSSRRN
jgi:hypothetical protein